MFDQQGSDAMYNMSTRYAAPAAGREAGPEARLGSRVLSQAPPAHETALSKFSIRRARLMPATGRFSLGENSATSLRQQGRALSSAVSGMLNFGDLGIRTDAESFNQNLSNAQLANAAQQQDFAQQLASVSTGFPRRSLANDVVKQLFGMNLDATNTNNRWAGQGFQDLLG